MMPLSPRASASCRRPVIEPSWGSSISWGHIPMRASMCPGNVECVRTRLRDLAIVVGCDKPDGGHGRVIAGVDDVVHHAGIVWILCE